MGKRKDKKRSEQRWTAKLLEKRQPKITCFDRTKRFGLLNRLGLIALDRYSLVGGYPCGTQLHPFTTDMWPDRDLSWWLEDPEGIVTADAGRLRDYLQGIDRTKLPPGPWTFLGIKGK